MLFKRRCYNGCDRIEDWSTMGEGREMEARRRVLWGGGKMDTTWSPRNIVPPVICYSRGGGIGWIFEG